MNNDKIVRMLAYNGRISVVCANTTKLVEEASKNAKKKVTDYKKITSGEVLNENTSFRNYAFISNNSIYIFNPGKLDEGVFEYKKVYDVPNNIKVMNIRPGYGADIKFIDYNDTLYKFKYYYESNEFWLEEENILKK